MRFYEQVWTLLFKENGKPRSTVTDKNSYLFYALLVDLALEKRIVGGYKQPLEITNVTPLNDPLLDEMVGLLQTKMQEKPIRLKYGVRITTLSKKFKPFRKIAEYAQQEGKITITQRRFLGIIPYHSYQFNDLSPIHAMYQTLVEKLNDTALVNPQEKLLLLLMFITQMQNFRPLNKHRKTLRACIRQNFPDWRRNNPLRAKSQITLPEFSDEVNVTLTGIMKIIAAQKSDEKAASSGTVG
jgi:hypothetical protein